MPFSRRLPSLAQLRLSSTLSTPSRLVPPYAHTFPPPLAPLSPPYAYTLSAPPTPSHFTPALRFALLPTESEARPVEAWREKVLASEEGRRRVQKAWEESVIALEKSKSSGVQIPQVAFHALAEHLANASTLEAIKSTGSVIVKDVVADAEAVQWAREIVQAEEERSGRAVYWHPALLALRANASLLSANHQLHAALTGDSEAPYVLASAVQSGLASGVRSVQDIADVWAVREGSSSHPSTSLSAHLILTPSVASLSPTALPSNPSLPPTSASVIYQALRPFFRATRSLISFYDRSAYLDPSNWTLLPPSSSSSATSAEAVDYPHLKDTHVSLPELNPGDMIFRHSSMDVRGGEDLLSVEVSPLARAVNAEYAQVQRERFEKGLPAPRLRAARGTDGEMVALEDEGLSGMIPTRGGREAMGY